MNHPDDAMIERFVIGAAGAEDDDDFVAHVSTCDVCARKLQREARLELALGEVRQAEVSATRAAPPAPEPAPEPVAEAVAVAERPGAPARAQTRRSAWVVAAGGLALAAAVLLGVQIERGRGLGGESGDPATPASGAERVVTCPDGPQQAGCVARANLAGATVEYPKDPSLLRLGRTPGLTLSLALVGTPNPPIDGIERSVADLEGPVKQCLDEALGSERSTSMAFFSVTAVVEPGGEVSTPARVRAAMKARGTGEVPPIVHRVLPCISAALAKAPFAANGKRTVIEVAVRYVWRA